MPLYRVAKQFTNWQQTLIEANSPEDALAVAKDDWDDYYTWEGDLWEYTGEVSVQLTDDGGKETNA
jgi:hypothetical protein